MDIEDIGIKLDDWKPEPKEHKLIQSKWRAAQNGDNFNQEVGRDEIKKIQVAIKKKYADHEIMQTYGITAQTLVAIKEGRLKPEEGQSRGSITQTEFDDINDIFKKIKKIENKFFGINCAFRELAKILFAEKEEQKLFIALLEKKRGKVKVETTETPEIKNEE